MTRALERVLPRTVRRLVAEVSQTPVAFERFEEKLDGDVFATLVAVLLEEVASAGHRAQAAHHPGLDEVDRLVRDYAVQVTEKPNGMRDAIFADLRRHFSEEQIVELTVRTALCGFFNRVNDTMQIGIEDGVVEDMLAHGVSEETLPEAVK